MKFSSTKIIELGSCAFRQWRADSHCKFIHGYRLIAKFYFTCDRLDERNWVVDFGGLKELKQVLEKQFDHTFCVSADDPLLEQFKALHASGAADLRIMEKGVGIERTTEWCFEVADAHVRGITKNRCWVEKVEVWEHDKNSAIAEYAAPTTFINSKHDTKVEGKFIAEQYELKLDQPAAPYAHAVGAPAPEITKVSEGGQIDNTPLKKDINPAPLYTKKSSGYGNLFGGTSWGV
jgi:6-pyruvoyltetrahydropterin/6-carboxytetrahydropterin synthase